MGNLQTAFDAIEAICNASDVGYSMGYDSRESDGLYHNWATGAVGAPRTLTQFGNYRYTDCSGLMSYGLYKGGYFDANPWFSTYNEATMLTNAGWDEFYPSGISGLQAGDIWFYDQGGGANGHTWMVYDVDTNGNWYRIMEAQGGHINNLANQVWISDKKYTLPSKSNQHYYRDTAGSTYTLHWLSLANFTMSGTDINVTSFSPWDYQSDECANNASMVANYCINTLGMTKEVVCGILGNMTVESGINPNIFNVGNGVWTFTSSSASYTARNTDSGYGLCQWTYLANGHVSPLTESGCPSNVFDDDEAGADANGNWQLQFIEISALAGQWNTQSGYNWAQFKTLTLTPEETCELFSRWYEMWNGGIHSSLPTRKLRARYWYDNWENWFQKSQGGGHTPSDNTEYYYIVQKKRKLNSGRSYIGKGR